MKEIKYIMMLGRPGCGKSYLYKNVISTALHQKGVKHIEKIDDFPILEELLGKDREFKKHVREDGGFRVTDWSIIDDVLKEIDDRLINKSSEGCVFLVEFARSDYRKAIRNFSEEVREKSLLLYIWAPYDVCAADNLNRYEKSTHDSEKSVDDHIVPIELMETYYKNDDLEEIYIQDMDAPPKGFYGWDIRFFNNTDRKVENVIKEEKFLSLIKEFVI
ncbi:hypothetical protein ACFLTD_00770 [Elusimicrobiota bacterium]